LEFRHSNASRLASGRFAAQSVERELEQVLCEGGGAFLSW